MLGNGNNRFDYDLPIWAVVISISGRMVEENPSLFDDDIKGPSLLRADGKKSFPLFIDSDWAEKFCTDLSAKEKESEKARVVPVTRPDYYLRLLSHAWMLGHTWITFDSNGSPSPIRTYPIQEVLDEFADRFHDNQ